MKLAVFAEKVGMSRVFDEQGNHIPVTLLQVKENLVVEKRTLEKNQYNALVVGFDEVKEKKLNKSQLSFFKKNNLPFFRKMREIRIDKTDDFEVNSKVDLDIFSIGQFVDVKGKSIGKGFAGAMKRWNFGGLRASHGVSVSHRSHGSTGNRQDPGKTFKGKKMAGHLGDKQITVQNLKVIDIDKEKGLLILKGAVPGCKGNLLKVLTASKKNMDNK